MGETDRRGKLNDEVFSYRATKDGRVLLYWHEKLIKMLARKDAQKFLARIDGLGDYDAQLVMAKATGNFKHGNERQASDSSDTE